MRIAETGRRLAGLWGGMVLALEQPDRAPRAARVLTLVGERLIEPATGLPAEPPGRRCGVVIALGAGDVLCRRLNLPVRCYPRLHRLLALRVEADWPLAGPVPAWDAVVAEAPGGRMRVELAMARPDRVETAMRAARAIGVVPERIDLARAACTVGVAGFRFGAGPEGAGLGRGVRRLVLGALLVWTLALAGLAAAQLWSMESARQQAAQRLAALRRDAEPLLAELAHIRSRIEAVARIRDESARNPSPGQLLDALSAALPQGTVLSALRLAGDAATVAGRTGDAAATLAALDRVPGLDGARLAAPVTRDPRDGRERFEIALGRGNGRP